MTRPDTTTSETARLDEPASAGPLRELRSVTESILSQLALPAAPPASGPSSEDAVSQSPRAGAPEGAVVGTLRGFAESGAPLVDFPGNPFTRPLEARTTIELDASLFGRELVLVFENAELSSPIVLGAIRASTIDAAAGAASQAAAAPSAAIAPAPSAIVDGREIVLTAERKIVLRCGKASISLARDGRVTIQGEHLLSRSRGVNRIKGGSVQIN